MSRLQSLKAATCLHNVAALLKFKPKALSFILYRKPAAAKYKSFQIQKRHGGTRQINAPSPDLMLLQRRLSDLLQDCVEEINQSKHRKDQLAHGFKRHRSIITNATKHRKRRFVFNIDLQDFFGTINFGRVRGFFLKDKNFALHSDVATVVAQIACHQNALPQGSPCSPVISNLIGHMLDIHLAKLAFDTGCTYSRYADDLTLSTNEPQFPPSIARSTKAQQHKWKVGQKLHETVTRTGFANNPQKTRMQYRTSRQDVTGLVVNSKVNVRSEYRRTVRAMVHRLFMTGHFELIETAPVPGAAGVLAPTKKEGTLAQLHGMLGHIYSVDQHNAKLVSPTLLGNKTSARVLSSKESLYRRFLMFKEFYSTSLPVVVCEGKTDNVYLRCAIKALAAKYPKLTTVSATGKVALSVRIFRYPQTSTGRILKLGGGTGDLNSFIHDYRREAARFKAPGKLNPVILLIDNDDGAQRIFSSVKQIAKSNPTGNETFTHVTENLYLIVVPAGKGGKKSVIEDAFTAKTRQTKIGGKAFSADNDFDTKTHYGKHTFSKYVDQHASKIDFSGFAGILDRIASVIEAHKKVTAHTP